MPSDERGVLVRNKEAIAFYQITKGTILYGTSSQYLCQY